MSPIRRGVIKRQILEILDSFGGRLLCPEQPTLYAHLSAVCVPPATVTEFNELLERMEVDGFVIRLRTDEGVKTRITDAGRAERHNR